MFKPTKPHHIANKAYVDNNSGGGGGGTVEGTIVFIPFEDSVPNCTLGDIRNVLSSGNFPIFTTESSNKTDYEPMESFEDNGSEAGYVSYIKIGGGLYQSSSGADDATWSYYD